MMEPRCEYRYPDQAVSLRAEVIDNRPVAAETWRMRFRAPRLAERILPGQFFMVRLHGCDDPLIGRPFAMYDVGPDWVDFVYLVGGKLTQRLCRIAAGDALDVWGPLGNGFEPKSCRKLVLVAGGIGQTPFLAVARERLGSAQYGAPKRAAPPVEQVTLLYGARSDDRFAGVEDFAAAGVKVELATDDGSRGHHGLVTDLLAGHLQGADKETLVYCCGPHAMMSAVARQTAAAGVECDVSLEEPMACGIGICFTCVARVKEADGSWDYRRTCLEGPVFAASRLVW